MLIRGLLQHPFLRLASRQSLKRLAELISTEQPFKLGPFSSVEAVLTDAQFIDFNRQPIQPPVLTVSVPGFTYQPDFISADEEAALMAVIEGGHWLPDLEQKRVQVYGSTSSIISP